jgi:RNA polymerase sigma factor (sigma-70 family)
MIANGYSKDNFEKLKGLLSSCINGDSESIMRFQDRFGEDIYNFPVKARHVNMEQAADFYCYCFEKCRIFKRLLTFKGLCALRTYQFRILNDLYNEWSREEAGHIISTEPLDDHKDFLENDVLDSFTVPLNEYNALLEKLTVEEKSYVKLLSYHEFGLDPAGMRMISEVSGRPLDDLMDSFIDIDQKLTARNEEYAERQIKLDEVEGRILDLERKIRKLAFKNEDPEGNSDPEWVALNERLEWRRRQKEELIKKFKKVKCQLSYRDIADLLNVSLGKVSEKINEIKTKISGLYNETIKVS